MTTIFDSTEFFWGDESPIINFPYGMIGLEEWDKFVLVSHPAGGPFHLLESVADKRMSFIVVEPNFFKSDYYIDQVDYDLGWFQVDSDEESAPKVYCIVSVEEDPLLISVNLLGPLLINIELGIGKQIVLSSTKYSARHIISG